MRPPSRKNDCWMPGAWWGERNTWYRNNDFDGDTMFCIERINKHWYLTDPIGIKRATVRFKTFKEAAAMGFLIYG